MPQYFQGVLGTTAMGSGLRLLPLVGGLLVGAVPAAAVVAAGRGQGRRRRRLRPARRRAGRRRYDERRLGRCLRRGVDGGRRARDGPRPGHLDVRRARRAVRREKRRRLGGAGGDRQGRRAVGHRHPRQRRRRRLHRPPQPGRTAAGRRGGVRQSVFGGVAVAQKLHSPALLASVRTAFVHGMDRRSSCPPGSPWPASSSPSSSCQRRTPRNRQCNRAQAQPVRPSELAEPLLVRIALRGGPPPGRRRRNHHHRRPPSRPGIRACPGPRDRAGLPAGPGRQLNDVKCRGRFPG